MRKLIFLIMLVSLVAKLAGCSFSTLNTISNTRQEIEIRIKESDDAYIKRLKEGM